MAHLVSNTEIVSMSFFSRCKPTRFVSRGIDTIIYPMSIRQRMRQKRIADRLLLFTRARSMCHVGCLLLTPLLA
jgi:predicted AAA+ superfamily ATPase